MIPGVKRPCLRCGVPTLAGSLCPGHLAEGERERSKRRGSRHYTGDYQRRAGGVRASATECWICHEGFRENDPWTADHLYPGEVDSPLLPAHRSCNSRRGNKKVD
jgi:hypothetical protein